MNDLSIKERVMAHMEREEPEIDYLTRAETKDLFILLLSEGVPLQTKVIGIRNPEWTHRQTFREWLAGANKVPEFIAVKHVGYLLNGLTFLTQEFEGWERDYDERQVIYKRVGIKSYHTASAAELIRKHRKRVEADA
jgi:hypothetical protein